MGLLDKVSDSVLKKVTKKETVRVNYEQLTEIVKEHFITGADDEFLNKVLKTAKGGGVFTQRFLKSNSERYTFFVGGGNRWFLGREKQSYVFDNVENKFYKLDKDRHWKKFYRAVAAAVTTEKMSRNAWLD